MKLGGKGFLIGGGLVVATLAGAAALLHSPAFHRQIPGLHGVAGVHPSGPAAVMVGDSGGDPAVNAHALEGIAAIGRRWD